jgi:hypothetical protein
MQSTSIAFDVEYSPSQEEAHKAEALWSRKHAGRLAIAAILPGILLIATPFLLLGNSGNHENSDKVVEPASAAQLNIPDERHLQNLRQPGVRSRVQLEEQPGGQQTYYYRQQAPAPTSYGAAAPMSYATPQYINPNYYYGAPAYQQSAAPVKPTDAQALTYDNAPNKMATLHALAVASREARRLKQGRQASPTEQWTQGMMAAEKAGAVLSRMHGGGAALDKAKARISKVLAQAEADRQLRKQVLKTAAEAAKGDDDDTAFDKILHREVGPQSVQMASDWLSTEVAAAPHGAKKTMYARAQLEAALSRVGGKLRSPTAEVADTEREMMSHGDNRGLAYEQQASQRIMSGAESMERNGQLFGRGLSRHGGMSSYASPWQAPGRSVPQGNFGAGAQYSAGGGGSGSQSGGNSGGVAPGLSSYDAQILANGPPS